LAAAGAGAEITDGGFIRRFTSSNLSFIPFEAVVFYDLINFVDILWGLKV
jgi:hypothetical protein